MCMSILHSQHLNHFTLITTVLVIFWRISKASEGFESDDEESSFYRWLLLYVFISTWQIWIVFSTSTKDMFVFSILQTVSCIVPLSLYFSFFVLDNSSQNVNLLENSHGFSKLFCTINKNEVDCRVEVQQFAPKSIFDCKVRNSSVEWDFCGTLCQSPACLNTSTKKRISTTVSQLILGAYQLYQTKSGIVSTPLRPPGDHTRAFLYQYRVHC